LSNPSIVCSKDINKTLHFLHEASKREPLKILLAYIPMHGFCVETLRIAFFGLVK
jgi:hypothetical protein